MKPGLPVSEFFRRKRRRGLFCCQGFQILVENAGGDSVSALITLEDKRINFALQFRAVSAEEEEAFSQGAQQSSSEGCIKLASSVRANYCPYCGTRLASLITPSNWKAFRSLVEKHKPLSLCGAP